MRALLLLVPALLCAPLALADRLILAPVGKKIPFGTARLEHLFDQGDKGRFRTALGIGLTEAIDAELTYESGEGEGRVISFDLGYNLVPPITNLSPGFSIGVRDGLNQTADGRFVYLAMTERIGLTGRYNGDTPAEITVGGAFGNRQSAYVAVMLPFRASFRVLAEYDSRRVSAAFEYRPVPQLWARWIHRQGQSLWSITVERTF